MTWPSPSELADRRERGRELCRRLCQDIASIAPKGIGRWDRAWEIVDEPSANFMVVLLRWEQTGDDGERPALGWWQCRICGKLTGVRTRRTGPPVERAHKGRERGRETP